MMRHRTIHLFRVAAVFLLFLQQADAHACDLCGAYVGVLPYDNQSALGIMYRYRSFSGYPGNTGTLFPSGRLASPPSVLHGNHNAATSPDDFETYQVAELRGKWFVHSRVELNIVLPFTVNSAKYGGISSTASGIGDVSLFGGFHLLRKTEGTFRHRVVVGTGVKLPSGNCSQHSAAGERLPLMQQTGTGTTDLLLYAVYTGGGYKFRWGATFSGKAGGRNKYGEQFSPAMANTLFAGYLLTKKSWNFLPQLQLYEEYMGGEWNGAIKVDGTVMNCVMAGAGLDVSRENFGLTLGLQLPAWEQEQPFNLAAQCRLLAGITWSFNQDNYLIHAKNN